MIKPETLNSWKFIKSKPGPDLTLFRVRFDWLENPRNGQIVKATIVEAPDWVNVVALTPAGELVVVRQYRFGNGEITTEIPAGIIEEGESSQTAAARELQEETGFISEDWEYLGWVAPNPAYLNNRCHHWLARDAEKVSSPMLDPGENLEVAVLSMEELKADIKQGNFRHSLAVSALAHAFDMRTLLKSSENNKITN
jgi:8-oxo-dGTP pyrophosphatase MutT (NUDIX family)